MLVLAVVEIGEIEAAHVRAVLGVFEGVADIGVAEFIEAQGEGIVGCDRDERDTPLPVVFRDCLNALLIRLRGRAMVAGKGNDQYLRIGEIGQCIGFPVDPWQTEIRGRCADWQRSRRVSRTCGYDRNEREG